MAASNGCATDCPRLQAQQGAFDLRCQIAALQLPKRAAFRCGWTGGIRARQCRKVLALRDCSNRLRGAQISGGPSFGTVILG